MKTVNHPVNQEIDWITPQLLYLKCREVLGGIDLNPCSSDWASEKNPAKKYYTKEENGLLQEWKAKTVFLNPPNYNEKITHQFWEKLFYHYVRKDVNAAIVLITNPLVIRLFSGAQLFLRLDFKVTSKKNKPHYLSNSGLLKIEGIQEQKRKITETAATLLYLPGSEKCNITKFYKTFNKEGTVYMQYTNDFTGLLLTQQNTFFDKRIIPAVKTNISLTRDIKKAV